MTIDHVAVLRWPEERASVERLRASGTPRLLLVAPDAEAPVATDCDEDWIRLPAVDDDVRARTNALAAKAARHSPRPEVKGDGRLAYRGRWVALSQTEEAIARLLADQLGEVVGRDVLATDWGTRPPSANAMRVHITRLRRRVGPLGLVVRSVHGRGYVMEPAEPTDS
ncbi:MAG TPA: winged helix-turn-helix domain-containing protein [Acidimicrobiales bacterium]|nr:winged helix-turn-helix domain-containing protein [Acidimicrobiales bacterium]